MALTGGGTYKVSNEADLFEIAKNVYGTAQFADYISAQNGGISTPKKGTVLKTPAITSESTPLVDGTGGIPTAYSNVAPTRTRKTVAPPLTTKGSPMIDGTGGISKPQAKDSPQHIITKTSIAPQSPPNLLDKIFNQPEPEADYPIGDTIKDSLQYALGTTGQALKQTGQGVEAMWNNFWETITLQDPEDLSLPGYTPYKLPTPEGTGTFSPAAVQAWQDYASSQFGSNPWVDNYLLSQGFSNQGTYAPPPKQNTPFDRVPTLDGLQNQVESLLDLDEQISNVSGTFSTTAIHEYQLAYAEPFGSNPSFDAFISWYTPYYADHVADFMDGYNKIYHIPTAVINDPRFPFSEMELLAAGFAPSNEGAYWVFDPGTETGGGGGGGAGEGDGGGGGGGSGGGGRRPGGYGGSTGSERPGVTEPTYAPKFNGLIRWRGVGF